MILSNRITSRDIAIALAVSIGVSGLASAAFAQNNREVIVLCLDAIAENDEDKARDMAESIQTMRNVPKFMQGDALQCLENATGENWQYVLDASRFVRVTEVNEVLSELAAARAEEERKQVERPLILQARKCEVLAVLSPLQARLTELISGAKEAERRLEIASLEARIETVETCQDWYQRDSLEALTNAVCNDVFTQVGVNPLETNGAYLQFEIASLENQIGPLQLQLEIMELGMLPEEALERSSEEQRQLLIRRLPREQRVQAEGMTLNEILLLLTEYERALCE